MSAPVLAFRNRKRKAHPLPIIRKIEQLHAVAPEIVTAIENAVDYSLKSFYEQMAAANIGKPVITIDRDDREGA